MRTMADQPPGFLLNKVPKRAEACMSTADMTSPQDLAEALGCEQSERSAKALAVQLLYTNDKLETLLNIKGRDTYF